MDPPDRTPGDDNADPTSRIRWEIARIIVLIGVAVVAFLVTRAIAASNRDLQLRQGVEWYEQGQRRLAAGDLEGAIAAFRHARVRNRGDRRYQLALARALAGSGQRDAARRALLALRASEPESPDVNLELARLAAAGSDVPEAVRYYHDALYASWPAESGEVRRGVRLELTRFLLAEGQNEPALSELVALSADLPDGNGSRAEIGRLFLQAGDARRALDELQRAVRAEPDEPDVLADAGIAAFQVGDYPLARQYLRGAAARRGDIGGMLGLAELVLGSDPLAPRIGAAARRRRLTDGFAYANERLQACANRRSTGSTASAGDAALRDEAQDFERRLPLAARDNDVIEDGLALIYRIERYVTQVCPPVTPLDRALLLIGERHQVDRP